MARRVFFSFHHSRDVWRAGQIRNCWVTKDRESAGFWDAATWETVKKKDVSSVQRWIDEQMKGTSVTVVLIGAETSIRKHVGYEICEGHRLGKDMLGIYIHNLKSSEGKTDVRGNNPFANWHIERGGRKVLLSELYPVYDWVNDGGSDRIGDWIEAAAKKAGR
jgi:hypothetical protein